MFRRLQRQTLCHKAAPVLRPAGGFTLVELVITLILVGILAAVAIPRFVGPGAFESRSVFEQTRAALQLAQKLAVARRGQVFVCLSGPGAVYSLTVASDAACAAPLADPVSGGAMVYAGQAGRSSVTYATNPATQSFSFNGLGQPVGLAGRVALTVSGGEAGDVARTLFVEAETGYVHSTP